MPFYLCQNSILAASLIVVLHNLCSFQELQGNGAKLIPNYLEPCQFEIQPPISRSCRHQHPVDNIY